MNWGLLPHIYELKSAEDRFLFLRSYCKSYLKEEILIEQLVRNVEGFRDFLPLAAQANARVVNFSKIASQAGVSDNTIRSYFQILEDTLMGFYLPAFHRSIRKRQVKASKFYFFDPGVKKALAGTSKISLTEQSSEYGFAFEHFLILECLKLNEYYLSDYKFSYYLTKDNVEVDLIVERPGQPDCLIEIKSTNKVEERMLNHLQTTKDSWDREAVAQCWSRDAYTKKINNVECLPWQEGLKQLF